MSRFTITGRRFVGPLAEPVRNDTESAGCDDYREAVRIAEDMSRRGWSSWVIEDQREPAAEPGLNPAHNPPGGRYRTLAEWRPNGLRVR